MKFYIFAVRHVYGRYRYKCIRIRMGYVRARKKSNHNEKVKETLKVTSAYSSFGPERNNLYRKTERYSSKNNRIHLKISPHNKFYPIKPLTQHPPIQLCDDNVANFNAFDSYV
ncbi:hypothetical protein CR513_22390, partial [Mucuna pruriens]